MNESDHDLSVQESPSSSSTKCIKPSGFVSACFYFCFLNVDDDDQFVFRDFNNVWICMCIFLGCVGTTCKCLKLRRRGTP